MTIKIGVCFFGITRSVSHTIGNIEKNIYQPLEKLGAEVKKFAHFFELEQIENARSGETGKIDLNEADLLRLDDVFFEKPERFLSESSFELVKGYGDFWQDNNKSIRNLYHQLHSMKTVTQRCLEWDPDIVLFLRPDLSYHDNFSTVLCSALKKVGSEHLFLPNWQHFDGFNDRFAIAVGREAIKSYGLRYNNILNFCRKYDAPLHSERLLKFSSEDIRVSFIPLRASRVRVNGVVVEELFLHYKTMNFAEWLDGAISLSSSLKKRLVWGVQKLRFGNPYKNLKK